MTRLEEKLYLQTVYDAIDQVYKLKKSQAMSSYEERLRASFSKLIIPDWYNPDYTSTNTLRKTKSHGHVPRTKRINASDESPDISISSSNGNHHSSFRHRSPSRSWSERPPLRHDSTTSSYDTNGDVINGRRATISNGSSYAPGVQRVAQSSTWYKPKAFTSKTTNGHTNEPPKPLPRYSKIDQERIHSLDSSSPPASLPTKIENVRFPIKPRTMAQAQIPMEESSIDISADADMTLVQKLPEEVISRTNSLRSLSSDAESYSSAVLPPGEKNLVGTDSSSYASVNDRCVSPSTASYHTAVADDTSSLTGYETPTPQLDNDGDDDDKTLSSRSSLSDLTHTETNELNLPDLDIIAVSTAEQESIIDSAMEQSTNVDRTLTIENPPQSLENTNWYEGSLETCLPSRPTASIETHSSELREIPNDESLREIDLNAVGDEFFLFSPRDSTDDEPSTKEILESPSQTYNRIFTIEEKPIDNPTEFDSNYSTIMITNLDDILVDDDDDDDDIDDDQQSSNRFLNGNLRRPIQEDILYEVEHENSFSDHSQNTSLIIPTDEQSSTKYEVNIDYLTSIDNHQNSAEEDKQQQQQQQSSTNDSNNNNNILPIYILPPLYTTTKSFDEPTSPSLYIDTNNNFEKFDSFFHQFSDITSPSAYASKIRHRHYSVGSYYDHKTTTVTTVHPYPSHYFLGSAPVSPLNRTTTSTTDSHYRHSSPFSYDNHLSINALRRVNPFLDKNPSSSSTYYRSSSLNLEEKSRVITYISPPRTTSKSAERTIPSKETQPAPIVPPRILSPPSTRMSSVVFPQYEMPIVRPKPTYEMPQPTQRTIFEEKLPSIIQENPLYSRIEKNQRPSPPPSIPRPKTSRGRVRTPSPVSSTVKEPIQNIYQEIDSTSTDDEQTDTPNADLQFIRGAIDRIFHFNGQSTTTDSTSDSSTYYEEVEEKEPSSTKKNSSQYPAVQAVQRFYNQKPVLTNGTDGNQSHSLNSNKSPPIVVRKSQQSKSSEQQERASSEEVDDTLNDIEDVEYQVEKNKRSITNKTSQETQTNRSRSTVPPIDIVTEMFIEQEEDEPDHLDAIDGDMVIFYDDIEIVEHLISSSCSSDSDSVSSSSQHYSKPANTFIHAQQPPPPIPARALKPSHLVNKANQTKSNSSSTNKTYELEKSLIRKKFDVNTVNGMLSRTGNNLPSSITHRHPSARHFVGKLNPEDSPVQPPQTNGHRQVVPPPPPPLSSSVPITKNSSTTLPTRLNNNKHRSIIADTNALVKQIQNSLSRNSLHDTQTNPKTLSTSNKDLRAFVSSTYSPSDENVIDNNGKIHPRPATTTPDDQTFKRQARLSKSFHNVSEYNPIDQYPKKETKTLPSKSVENNLNEIPPSSSSSSSSQPKQIPLNLTSLVSSTSFSALPNSDDNARMLSMKWYTGQVSENSEIGPHVHPDDLLHGYIFTHSNRETQAILTNLQASSDARIHAALDDIRSRVAQFDASKSQEDLQVFMRYLESRLRDLNNKKSNRQPLDKSRSSSISTESTKEQLSTRQLGRQHIRSTDQSTPPRRASQSSSNQENPAVFDEMLNTVLGLPKKGVSAFPQNFPSKREKPTPLVTTNTNTNGRDIGKRLFESGTYKDPRLIYDGPKRQEKEDEPLETSV